MQEIDASIKGINYSTVFVCTAEDDDDNPAVRIAVHIIGGSLATRISLESAKEMITALQSIVDAA